jgi:GNAT superfamily N-acetyltransferase
VRVWRNASGPRLGLVGVLPEHRSQPLAAVLLRQALTAAAAWGFDTFVSETSPHNPSTYPRVQRLGLEPAARLVQLVRPSRHGAASR